MTILTRKQLQEQRNLTPSFIKKHDREMGGRGRPRRYDLELVDAFLRRYFREEQTKEWSAQADAERLARQVNDLIAGRGNYHYTGEMVGRGGRQ